jgi:hypothetical protein
LNRNQHDDHDGVLDWPRAIFSSVPLIVLVVSVVDRRFC